MERGEGYGGGILARSTGERTMPPYRTDPGSVPTGKMREYASASSALEPDG
jgi:hypothetical protein